MARKHYCGNENCENEMLGDVVGFKLYDGTTIYFCDEDCLQEWVSSNVVYNYIYEDGEVE